VNNRQRNIGLFPVPRTVKRSFVDVSTRESSSPAEGGNSQKNFLGKLYDATLGKIVALFLHLVVRFVVRTSLMFVGNFWNDVSHQPLSFSENTGKEPLY
jgi:hypothetical protein